MVHLGIYLLNTCTYSEYVSFVSDGHKGFMFAVSEMRLTSRYFGVCSVPVVVVFQGAIVHHGRDVWMPMLYTHTTNTIFYTQQQYKPISQAYFTSDHVWLNSQSNFLLIFFNYFISLSVCASWGIWEGVVTNDRKCKRFEV